MKKIKTMNTDNLVYETTKTRVTSFDLQLAQLRGELKPLYTIRDKNTKQTIATASNIEIALRIIKTYFENNRKGLEIFNEARKEVFKVDYDLLFCKTH